MASTTAPIRILLAPRVLMLLLLLLLDMPTPLLSSLVGRGLAFRPARARPRRIPVARGAAAVPSSPEGGGEGSEKGGEIVVDWDWEKVAEQVFSDDERPIIIFDGVCNLCDAGVNFAMDQDEGATFRFASLQSRVAQSLLLRCGRSLEEKADIVLVTKTDAHFSSDAVSMICMGLDAAPLRWFGMLGQYTPGWVRDGIYEFVSSNRYRFGEADSCRLDFDGVYTSRFVSDPQDDEAGGED